MTPYNPVKLDKNKYGILGLYVGKLRELQQGKIPTQYDFYSNALKQSLPFFPNGEMEKYKRLLKAGDNQVRYLAAKLVADCLKEEEPNRNKTIDDFLKEK